MTHKVAASTQDSVLEEKHIPSVEDPSKGIVIMPLKNWRSKKQPVASSYRYKLQGKSQSPTLGEELSPLTGDGVLVSNMHTPSGTTPEENALRLSGAFHVESENDPTNLTGIVRHSPCLGDETSILESRTPMLLELTSKSEGEDPTKGKGKNNSLHHHQQPTRLSWCTC